MISRPFDKNASLIKSFAQFEIPNLRSTTSFNSHTLDDESNIHSEIDNSYIKNFRCILKNKREAKELRKINEKMLEDYVSSLIYVNMKTAKGYYRIISKFLLHSPSVDPEKLEPFLIKEFKKDKRVVLYINV